MNSEVLFAETQKFKQWWLWLVLAAANALSLFGVVKQVIFGKQFGDRPATDLELILTAALILLLTILFFYLRLETRITNDGVYVRFFPFHLLFHTYGWTTIKRALVRQYSAIGEYGGWGLRLGLFGRGRAFNVSGNKGLQLEFSDNKKLLIGTNKPAELTETLSKIGQLKE